MRSQTWHALSCLDLLFFSLPGAVNRLYPIPTAPAAPAAALPVGAKAPFRLVVVEQQTIAAGAEQAISVTLDQQAATTTILQLTITYPGGETQDVLDQTLGSTATLNWLVPDDVRSGEARFRLTTSGCGCGDRSGERSHRSRKHGRRLLFREKLAQSPYKEPRTMADQCIP